MSNKIKAKERPILFNGEMVRAILDGRKTQTRRIMKPQPGPDHYLGENPVYGRGVTSNKGEYGVVFKWDTRKDLILNEHYKCPFGAPGDELWVRETFADVNTENGPGIIWRADGCIHFCVDDAYPVEYERYPKMDFTMWVNDLLNEEPGHKWRPSIHMPRWASRLQLRVTNVRVERVQEISEEDAQAEGCTFVDFGRNKWGNKNAGWRCGDAATHTGQALDAPRFAFANLWNSINENRGFGWNANPWVWVVDFEVIHDE